VSDEFFEDEMIGIAEVFLQQAAEDLHTTIEEQALTANASPFTGILHETGVNAITTAGASFEDADEDHLD
jgi:hypothetical protein